MKLGDLETGMMVRREGNDRVLKVILGTSAQDVVFVSQPGEYVTLGVYYNDDMTGKCYSDDITKVVVLPCSRNDNDNFRARGDVWYHQFKDNKGEYIMFIWIARCILYALGIIKTPRVGEVWVLIPLYDKEKNLDCNIIGVNKDTIKYTISNTSYELEIAMFITLYKRK